MSTETVDPAPVAAPDVVEETAVAPAPTMDDAVVVDDAAATVAAPVAVAPVAAPAKTSTENYNEAFPSLGGMSTAPPGGAWTNTAQGMSRIKSREISTNFIIPFHERR